MTDLDYFVAKNDWDKIKKFIMINEIVKKIKMAKQLKEKSVNLRAKNFEERNH